MEEITSAVAVPFSIGNLIQKESAVTTHMEITGLKLMTNTASILVLNPASIEGCQSFSVGSGEDGDTDISPQHQQISVSLEVKENQVAAEPVSEMVLESDSYGRNEEEFETAKDFQFIHTPASQSSVSNKSSLFMEESAISRTNLSEMNAPNTVTVDDNIGDDKYSLNEPVTNTASVVMKHESGDRTISDGPDDSKPIAAVHDMPEKQTYATRCDNGLELSYTPLFGFSSVIGRRQEMEDAIVIKPQLFQVPSMMLMDDHVNENTHNSLAHFFGVYDGHGGSQVANYCQKHLHSVLVEEIEAAESSLSENSEKDNWHDRWKKVLTNCFQKVDDAIVGVHAGNGEKNSNDGSESSTEETLAPETVGSTALVAILTQNHIIVANCGDSRAVLCRGKEALPLSIDQKPNREDEWERIEGSGGKIIQWNGYRVLGVLAVSRSIGDKYLKPWIIPHPEVEFVPREKNDECLILASDGLWDVMTNEEVCDIARKRILIWHKKNGTNVPTVQDHGVDPAAHYAAEYLSKLAIQRGSKDNISVIVIDLKAQRQFKKKP